VGFGRWALRYVNSGKSRSDRRPGEARIRRSPIVCGSRILPQDFQRQVDAGFTSEMTIEDEPSERREVRILRRLLSLSPSCGVSSSRTNSLPQAGPLLQLALRCRHRPSSGAALFFRRHREFDGFYMTCYVFGYSDHEEQARKHWESPASGGNASCRFRRRKGTSGQTPRLGGFVPAKPPEQARALPYMSLAARISMLFAYGQPADRGEDCAKSDVRQALDTRFGTIEFRRRLNVHPIHQQ